jgi:hypothetical protein
LGVFIIDFPIRGSGFISGLKNIDYFRIFAYFSPKSKAKDKISKISPNYLFNVTAFVEIHKKVLHKPYSR